MRPSVLLLVFVIVLCGLAGSGCGADDSRRVESTAEAPASESADSGGAEGSEPKTYDAEPETSSSPDSSADGEEDSDYMDEADPAYQLAVIDGANSPDESEVAPYAASLKRLIRKCRNTRTRLADYTVNAQQLIEREGFDPPELLWILRGMEDSIPRGYPRRDCKDLYAMFVSLTVSE